MKIRDVSFVLMRQAIEQPYGDAQGLKTHRTGILVRIDTEGGLTGWGDISNVRDDANPVHLRQARDTLIGQDALGAGKLVRQLGALGPRIAAGVDIALADIRGKAAGMSLSTLLGGAMRASQPCYASLQNANAAEDVEADAVTQAERAMRLGFRHIKMKVGWRHPDADARWINTVLDTLPADVPLAIDANRVLDIAGAERLVRGIRDPGRIAWFEEPCSNRFPETYAELRRRLPMPVAGGESMGVAMLRDVIAGRMMDIVQPDLVGHGGFTPMQQLHALCDAYGVRLIPHCFDGQMLRVATLHLLASWPDWEAKHGEYDASPLEVDISPNPLCDELLEEPLRPDAEGRMVVPAGPGLGVAANEDFIRRVGQPIPL